MQKLESLPVIDSTDNLTVEGIADYFKDKLINILRQHKNYIDKVYHRSGYSNEVSYEEFFIWWYHFIYTKTTDLLAEKKILSIPKEGNFFYRMN